MFCRNETKKPVKRMSEFDAFLCFSHHNVDIARKTILEMEEKYQLKVLFDIRDFIRGLTIRKNIEIAVRCSKCAIFMLSREFLESFLCQQELQQCLIEQEQDPSFEIFILLTEEKRTLLTKLKQVLPWKMSQEMIKDRCLNIKDPQLLDNLFSKMRASKSDGRVTDNDNAIRGTFRGTFRHNSCSR